MTARRALPAAVVAAIVLIAGGAWWIGERREAERIDAALHYAIDLEREGRHAEAIPAYRALLERELSDARRADVRYRLARALIRANDLNGALGVLRTLTTEDAPRGSVDAGTLYLDLSRKAQEVGNAKLARIAAREGSQVAPARHAEFVQRLQELE